MQSAARCVFCLGLYFFIECLMMSGYEFIVVREFLSKWCVF